MAVAARSAAGAASMREPRRSSRTGKLICGCGQGYMSARDSKCGHCRTKRERREFEAGLRRADRLASLFPD